MSDPLGTYTFLPWTRRGIANEISGVSATGRATVQVRVDITGTDRDGNDVADDVSRNVQLYGPGDIIGVERDEISRVEPEDWVSNFEPNYLPAIEFYSEDFLWRYSPASPDGRQLRPWLALVVLETGETGEFREGQGMTKGPLPFIEVTAPFANVFPNASDSWAWAHVHINRGLSASVVDTDASAMSAAADVAIQADPDGACCRLMAPRKLAPSTSYTAFLIPAFEAGRLAGLGRGADVDAMMADATSVLTATTASWDTYAARPDGTSFPVYHRWSFQTGKRGDFESLVRLLEPQVVDPSVGHREMDVTRPAPNIDGISKPEIAGILRLGGALKAPLFGEALTEFQVFDEWAEPYPRPFQQQLAAFLNLADSYQADGVNANSETTLPTAIQDDPLPLVTPPIYGRWHALSERVLTDRNGAPLPNDDNWLHDLNLDPRWRTAAGFGTKVIQDGQERWMESAWEQVGDVLEANRRIRGARLAATASRRYHDVLQRTATPRPGSTFYLAAPVAARVMSQGVTLRHAETQSPLGVALTSAAMRRTMRARGPVARRMGIEDTAQFSTDLIQRTNDGEITPAPPPEVPSEALTPNDLGEAAGPQTDADRRRAQLARWIRDNWIAVLLFLLALLLLVFALLPVAIAATVAVAIGIGAVGVWRLLRRALAQGDFAETLTEDGQTPEAVEDLPGRPGFTLVDDTDVLGDPPAPNTISGSDSPEAERFKLALADQYRVIEASREADERPPLISLDLPAVARDVVAGLAPSLTLKRWVESGVLIPPRIRDQMGEHFVEAMVYPEFDVPMYEPLRDAGTELFVPNLDLVPPDSVTLLETNQKFIEAYMVGINHEFARELLWREYPTDQRGSYFRQFWDVSKKLAQSDDIEVAREQLKDIKPIHRWPRGNALGDNDNREAGQEAEEELVLVIRGELLKKYPNTVISAQPAAWQLKDGEPDKTKERVFDETQTPIAPIYEARVAPDIYFFGFDLTAEVARGDDAVDDKPGWFFRIEEVPGDARFGFDIAREPGSDINVWNDMSWADAFPGITDGQPLNGSDISPTTLTEPTAPDVVEKVPQWESDRDVPLDANLSSAELAYITLQTPVLMAVHAAELLPDQEASDG